MPEVRRMLDSQERARGTGQILFVAKFQGEINLDLFKSALRSLSERHLVLKSFLKTEDSNLLLCAHTEEQPKLIIVDSIDTPPEALRKEYTYDAHERNIVFYLGVSDENAGYLAVGSNHIVTDARSIFDIFGLLLEVYATLIEGGKPEIDGSPALVKSSMELLQERWGRDTPVPSVEKYVSDVREFLFEDNSYKSHTWRQEQVFMDKQETDKITTAAKKHGTSVNALLSAALLAQMRCQDRRSGALPMIYTAPVDLRNRVTPAVQPLETTNFVFQQISKIELTKNINTVQLAHDIKTQMSNDIASRNLYAPGVMVAKWWNDISERGINCMMVSNPGRNRLPQVGGLNIFNLSTVAANTNRLGNRQASGNLMLTGLYTSEGRMTLGGTYVGPDMMDSKLCLRAANRVLSLC